MKDYTLLDVDLRLFDAGAGVNETDSQTAMNVNVTTQESLSVENKTYYDRELIRLAEPELIHDQFGQKKPIPKNGGKTIEFRQFDPLPEMTRPLVEGVTPDGQSMSAKALTATVRQYGGYVTYSDVVSLTTIDPVILEMTRAIASQAGRSLDTITREVLNSGTVVQFAGGATSRERLHYTSTSDNNNLTVAEIKKAVRFLKNQNAPMINGYYIGIIHPDCTYDLMNDPEWKAPHEYVDTKNIYRGEIGSLYGVRFVENTRAKVFKGEDLAEGGRTLTVNGAVSATNSVAFDGGTVAESALVGRMVLVGGTVATVTANTTTALTLDTKVTAADNSVIYPGEGGADGQPVYATLIFGDDAYGVTEVQGGGLQHIVKPLGSSGVADPLNQRGSVGWKAMKTAELLVPQYIVRVESTASP